MSSDAINNKTKVIYKALCDAYTGDNYNLELNKVYINEDVTAMLYAMYAFFSRVTASTALENDIIDFTHQLNKLAVIDALKRIQKRG